MAPLHVATCLHDLCMIVPVALFARLAASACLVLLQDLTDKLDSNLAVVACH